MTWAISVMIGVILFCVVVICYMVSNAMDYDPAWDDPPDKVDVVNYDDD